MFDSRTRLSTISLLMALVFCSILLPTKVQAVGKVVVYGIRMDPNNDDAEEYSRPGWGAGFRATLPIPQIANILAGNVGMDVVNLLSETVNSQDPDTFLRTELHTNQDFARLYLGGEIGPHGRGFLRPFLGANIALVFYGISNRVVIPNDADPDNPLVQNLGSDNRFRFGYDITTGIDLNISDKLIFEGGVRYLKSFGVPQQLSDVDAIKVHPDYIQFFVGMGLSFKVFRE